MKYFHKTTLDIFISGEKDLGIYKIASNVGNWNKPVLLTVKGSKQAQKLIPGKTIYWNQQGYTLQNRSGNLFLTVSKEF